MDLIRRDTDYAFRFVAQLTAVYGAKKLLSARVLAKDNKVPYALTCKILQKLAAAEIVRSTMGPKGGFQLSRDPGKTEFKQVVEAVQGPVSVNRCLMGNYQCPLKGSCPVHSKLAKLQTQINGYLKELTLQEFSSGDSLNG
jgi:Rrf2 family protein